MQAHPGRVVVATGAVESHAVFKGNDLPGVWLGRGAARMAGAHGVKPGNLAVVATDTPEGLEHMRTLMAAGLLVSAVVVPESLEDEIRDGVPVVLPGGKIVEAEGRKHLRAVILETGVARQRIECDTLVRLARLRSARRAPSDGDGPAGRRAPATWCAPGCTLEEAVESGIRAGNGETAEPAEPVEVAIGNGRLRLPLRGRRGERPRAGVARGLDGLPRS